MFLFQNARGKRFRRVVIQHRHNGLQDNRPGVEILVHKMHRAAGEIHAVFQRLPLRLEARKRGQQRGMNIQNAPAKRGNKKRRQQAHESRQANQVHFIFREHRGHQPVIRLALQPLGGNHLRRNSAFGGARNPRRAFAIADHDGDFRAGNASRGDAIGQRLKIRPAPAQKHGNLFGHDHCKLAYAAPEAKREDEAPSRLNERQSVFILRSWWEEKPLLKLDLNRAVIRLNQWCNYSEGGAAVTTRLRFFVLMILGIGTLVQLPLHATRAQQAQETATASGPQLIRIDAVVTGKDGKPIEDAWPQSFAVQEDGLYQALVSVEHFAVVNTDAWVESDESPIMIDPNTAQDREKLLPIARGHRMIVLFLI